MDAWDSVWGKVEPVRKSGLTVWVWDAYGVKGGTCRVTEPLLRRGFGPSPGGAGVAPGWLDRKVSFTEKVAKVEYINPSMPPTEQDIWILLKIDSIWSVSCCLYNTAFSVWIEGQMKKNALWLWRKQVLKKPEQCQLFTTSSDRLYLPCAEPKSAHCAKKGYTFNLSLEEDILMMQKLHDRCDTNKFLVHYQPES